jgi:phage terminase small subunit
MSLNVAKCRLQRGPNVTHRQLRFVTEFLTDFNATKAARRAGYSLKNASQIGSKTSRLPAVADAIQKGMEEQSRARQAAWAADLAARQ